jgi:hypothetical protein
MTTVTFSIETASRLRDAFERHEQRQEDERTLADALSAMCTEAHYRKMPAAEIVFAMRHTWEQVRRPVNATEDSWSKAYYAALGKCLAVYYAHCKES